MIKHRLLAAVVMTAVAVSGFALTPEHTDWGKGPASYFFTKEEAAQWKNIKSDDEAEKFIALFWARRDPTPNTPRNEFREDFDMRVATADKEFMTKRKKGSLTDRGRVLILFGAPTRVTRSAGDATQGFGQQSQSDLQRQENANNLARHTWIWEGDRAQELFGRARVQFNFVDQFNAGDFNLQGSTGDLRKGQDKVVAQALTQPNLTEVPAARAAAPVPVPAAAATAPSTTPASPTQALTFKNTAFRSAIDEFRAAKITPAQASVVYTEFISPSGDFFVPMQLYIPKSSNLTADSVTTFFGVIEDASGAAVSVFEEPAKLSTSKGDLYFDKSLTLKPGSYKATLGLSGADNKPVVMSTANIELKEMSKDAAGVTRLILANDVHETDTAAPAGAPFAFGKLKVVPKGDRVFTNKDELTYAVELLGFGIDEGTNLPKVQVKLELSGKDEKGKALPKITAPLSEVTALPLSGQTGAGQYLVISTIPLGEMTKPLAPGDYTLTIKVYDQVKKQNFTAEQTFKLIAAS